MGILVLGPLTIEDSVARLSPRETLVLAALAVKAGEVLGPDQLADVIWRDSPPRSWHKNLQSCIVRLRKVLGPEAIETSPQGYRLNLARDEVDARQFEDLVARGRDCSRLANPSGRRTRSAKRSRFGGVAPSRSWRSGSPGPWRRRGSASSGWTPRSGGSTRPCSPDTTETS